MSRSWERCHSGPIPGTVTGPMLLSVPQCGCQCLLALGTGTGAGLVREGPEGKWEKRNLPGVVQWEGTRIGGSGSGELEEGERGQDGRSS